MTQSNAATEVWIKYAARYAGICGGCFMELSVVGTCGC